MMSKCRKCNEPNVYVQKYDAFACKSCNIWNEKKCVHGSCILCKGRPEKPFEPSTEGIEG